MGRATQRKYDMAQLLEQPAEWTSSRDVFPWKATVNGQTWQIGISKDRENPYRLAIDGVEVGNFKRWPAIWGEPIIRLSAEDKWLQQHKNEYRGEWVFLEDGRLFAHNKKYRAGFEEARAAGAVDPISVYIDECTLPSI